MAIIGNGALAGDVNPLPALPGSPHSNTAFFIGGYGTVLSQSGSYWWSPKDVQEGEAHVRDYAARARLPLRFWIEVGLFEHGSIIEEGPHNALLALNGGIYRRLFERQAMGLLPETSAE